LATKQPGFKSGRLQSVVRNAGEGLQEADQDIDELRARILTAWDEMDQRIIDATIRQWRTRLRACIKAKGGHFEHTLSQ